MLTSRYNELFEENVILTMERLVQATGRPRESILRDLRGMGYYSSYNARGKYYTLGGTPVFDGFGLWKFQNAFFSARRTLLDTAEYLVGASDAGRTHDELRQILGIPAQNALYQLTAEGRIARIQHGAMYVYFAGDRMGEQEERRRAMPAEPAARRQSPTIRHDAGKPPDIAPSLVIDILVAVLRGHETDAAALGHLGRTGSQASAAQVAEVFRHYGLGKKNSRAKS